MNYTHLETSLKALHLIVSTNATEETTFIAAVSLTPFVASESLIVAS